MSANYALITPLFVEYFGMDGLAESFGITSMVEGLGILLGPPLGGEGW